VKLLFDENLSPRLAKDLEALFPGSQHADHVGLHGCSDEAVWEHARLQGFTIVSKDNDFRQRSFLKGAPPKVIWLSVGNGVAYRLWLLRPAGTRSRGRPCVIVPLKRATEVG
jgi:predicted nuclease of predicted toxin-antitoxin system